jgi:sugar-specific transcriptional regulator TrmB
VSDVIGDLRRDLEGRLREVERQLGAYEPLLREREQLQEALAKPPFSGARAPKRPAAAAPARKSGGTRAPRGANREAILKVVGDRPGVTATEIADVTKISRAVTYNTLAKLVEQGKLAKTELPGGQTGYKAAL